MDTQQFFLQDEPPQDDDATQKQPPPVFDLAGLSMMATLIDPNGGEHWVRKDSPIYYIYRRRGYRVGGNS